MPVSPSRGDTYFPGDYLGLTATEHDFLAFYVQPHDGDPGSVFFSRIAPADTECAGDCDGNGGISIADVVTMVNIGLGLQGPEACASGDADGSGSITINEIVAAVNQALQGCG